MSISDMQDNDAMVVACKKLICEKLPEDNYIVLNHLMELLHLVSRYLFKYCKVKSRFLNTGGHKI